MKNKKNYIVLGLPDNFSELIKKGKPMEEEFGTFPTQKLAEACVMKSIGKFKEFGMGMVERVFLSTDYSMMSRQWNYTIQNGKVYRSQNHHDLW